MAVRLLRRYSDWMFTIFEVDWTHQRIGRATLASKVRYIVYQQELAPTTNRPHFQGFVIFKRKVTMKTAKKILCSDTAHMEPRKGTRDEARAYCMKQDTRVPGTEPVEVGEWSGEVSEGPVAQTGDAIVSNSGEGGSDSRVRHVANLLHTGGGIVACLDAYPAWTVNHLKAVHWLWMFCAPPRRVKPLVEWCYGPTGSGKSKYAMEKSEEVEPENAYWKPPGTKWWDGYVGQPLVVIDDYRYDIRAPDSEQLGFWYLLRLFDRYPLSVEVKHGYVPFTAMHIIVTAPHDPDQMFVTYSADERAQLKRRIDRVIVFPQPQSQGQQQEKDDEGSCTPVNDVDLNE